MCFLTRENVHMYPPGFLVADNRISEKGKKTNDAMDIIPRMAQF